VQHILSQGITECPGVLQIYNRACY